MFNVFTSPPSDNRKLRTNIYEGKIYKLPASLESLFLVSLINEQLSLVYPEYADLRRAQFRYSNAEFMSRLTTARQRIAQSESIRDARDALFESLGFEISDLARDAVRIRAIQHNGHLIEEAASAYYAHRDTWYANPQCQINFWIPLHDVRSDEVFSIYPQYFREPVSNNSAEFDYDEFKNLAGFQHYSGEKERKPSGAVYPAAFDDYSGNPAMRIAMALGEILIFSAAHLHQTFPNASGQTRLSTDFRVVSLSDLSQGLGAVNVDNYSSGNSTSDYHSDSSLAG